MKNKKKLLVVLACLALCVCTVVTGTLAWLTDKTETVTNTFSPSNIQLTLTETGTTDNKKEFKMIPGQELGKDPKVTVLSGSEACWLFVTVKESNNFATYLEYTMNSNWTLLTTETDGTKVYYYNGTELNGLVATDKTYEVLDRNVVTVKGTVTKANMNAIDGIDKNGATDTDAANAEIAARPTLTFTAYAIQQLGFNDTAKTELQNATAAWNEVRTLG